MQECVSRVDVVEATEDNDRFDWDQTMVSLSFALGCLPYWVWGNRQCSACAMENSRHHRSVLNSKNITGEAKSTRQEVAIELVVGVRRKDNVVV